MSREEGMQARTLTYEDSLSSLHLLHLQYNMVSVRTLTSLGERRGGGSRDRGRHIERSVSHKTAYDCSRASRSYQDDTYRDGSDNFLSDSRNYGQEEIGRPQKLVKHVE